MAQLSSTISNGESIYTGERSEVIKAIIMAGADRATENTSTNAQISDYIGLDSRFGAGQINVFNNYQIMAAGEQNSQQDGGSANLAMMGYHYDAHFGGTLNSNDTATYAFTTQSENMQLSASLVWNIDIEFSDSNEINAILHNLDLFLFDVTDETESLVASSTSNIDNTENLWYFLDQGRDYKLQIKTANGSVFNWDYGFAWKISAIPIPATGWLFMSAILGLSMQWRKK